ncbi:MAG: type II secretion system protein [Opitutaceae bacterium]|jgi:prepilin-type N-terminal cleavage/methylation domain-containing protein/prepilin-type processing-associated H-X9-DG protein
MTLLPRSLASGRSRRTAHSAFTLVELLAVIVIVAVLAALVIPVASHVRSKAQQSLCTSNMRLYLQAIPLFAADNRGLVPNCWQTSSSTAEARTQLAPYLQPPPGLAAGSNALFQWAGTIGCATTEKTDKDRSWVFGFNSYTGRSANAGPALPLNSFSEPSRLIYIIDTTGSRAIRPETLSSLPDDFRQATPRPHEGKVNAGYLDGHVVSVLASTLTYADFTRGTPSYATSHDTRLITTAAYDR